LGRKSKKRHKKIEKRLDKKDQKISDLKSAADLRQEILKTELQCRVCQEVPNPERGITSLRCVKCQISIICHVCWRGLVVKNCPHCREPMPRPNKDRLAENLAREYHRSERVEPWIPFKEKDPEKEARREERRKRNEERRAEKEQTRTAKEKVRITGSDGKDEEGGGDAAHKRSLKLREDKRERERELKNLLNYLKDQKIAERLAYLEGRSGREERLVEKDQKIANQNVPLDEGGDDPDFDPGEGTSGSAAGGGGGASGHNGSSRCRLCGDVAPPGTMHCNRCISKLDLNPNELL